MNQPEIKRQPDLKCCYLCEHYFDNFRESPYCTLGAETEDTIHNMRKTYPTNICDVFKKAKY